MVSRQARAILLSLLGATFGVVGLLSFASTSLVLSWAGVVGVAGALFCFVVAARAWFQLLGASDDKKVEGALNHVVLVKSPASLQACVLDGLGMPSQAQQVGLGDGFPYVHHVECGQIRFVLNSSQQALDDPEAYPRVLLRAVAVAWSPLDAPGSTDHWQKTLDKVKCSRHYSKTPFILLVCVSQDLATMLDHRNLKASRSVAGWMIQLGAAPRETIANLRKAIWLRTVEWLWKRAAADTSEAPDAGAPPPADRKDVLEHARRADEELRAIAQALKEYATLHDKSDKWQSQAICVLVGPPSKKEVAEPSITKRPSPHRGPRLGKLNGEVDFLPPVHGQGIQLFENRIPFPPPDKPKRAWSYAHLAGVVLLSGLVVGVLVLGVSRSSHIDSFRRSRSAAQAAFVGGADESIPTGLAHVCTALSGPAALHWSLAEERMFQRADCRQVVGQGELDLRGVISKSTATVDARCVESIRVLLEHCTSKPVPSATPTREPDRTSPLESGPSQPPSGPPPKPATDSQCDGWQEWAKSASDKYSAALRLFPLNPNAAEAASLVAFPTYDPDLARSLPSCAKRFEREEIMNIMRWRQRLQEYVDLERFKIEVSVVEMICEQSGRCHRVPYPLSDTGRLVEPSAWLPTAGGCIENTLPAAAPPGSYLPMYKLELSNASDLAVLVGDGQVKPKVGGPWSFVSLFMNYSAQVGPGLDKSYGAAIFEFEAGNPAASRTAYVQVLPIKRAKGASSRCPRPNEGFGFADWRRDVLPSFMSSIPGEGAGVARVVCDEAHKCPGCNDVSCRSAVHMGCNAAGVCECTAGYSDLDGYVSNGCERAPILDLPSIPPSASAGN